MVYSLLSLISIGWEKSISKWNNVIKFNGLKKCHEVGKNPPFMVRDLLSYKRLIGKTLTELTGLGVLSLSARTYKRLEKDRVLENRESADGSFPKLAHIEDGRKRILIVEDDLLMQKSLLYCFKREGHLPEVADSVKEARIMLSEVPFDLVITDYQLEPGETGLDLLVELKTQSPDLPVVVMSGLNEESLPGLSKVYGAYAFYQKPFDLADFVNSCKDALREAGKRKNNPTGT